MGRRSGTGLIVGPARFGAAAVLSLPGGLEGALAGGKFAVGQVQVGRAATSLAARCGGAGLGGAGVRLARGLTRRARRGRTEIGLRARADILSGALFRPAAALGFDHHCLGAAVAEALPDRAGGGRAPGLQCKRRAPTRAVATRALIVPAVVVVPVAHPLALLASGARPRLKPSPKTNWAGA